MPEDVDDTSVNGAVDAEPEGDDDMIGAPWDVDRLEGEDLGGDEDDEDE